jgi:hypothetical protein
MGALLVLALFGAAADEPVGCPDELRVIGGVQSDLPGPSVLRELAQARYQASACDFAFRWTEFVAGRETTQFLIQSAVRLMEAHRDLSIRPEVHLDALERHLRLTLEGERIQQRRLEEGKIPINDFRPALADAKIWFVRAIFEEQRSKAPPSAKQLEKLWDDLGSKDVARACRSGWQLQACGPRAERLFRQHLKENRDSLTESADLIAVVDGIGEVDRDSTRVAAEIFTVEGAAERRRLLRAQILIRGMAPSEGR